MGGTPRITQEKKALAAAALASGMGIEEAAEAAGLHRSSLWRMDTEGDPEFAALREKALGQIIEKGVKTAVAELRRIGPKAVKALERGIEADTRFQVFSKTISTVEGAGKEAVRTSETVAELVPIPDLSLSVRAAGMALDRVPELGKKQTTEVTGTLEVRLAEVDSHGPREWD